MKFSYYIVFLLLVFSCSQGKKDSSNVSYKNDEGVSNTEKVELDYFEKRNSKDNFSMVVKDVTYQISVINGLKYVERASRLNIAEKDKAELSKESVIMLEFLYQDQNTNIFNSESIQLGKDDSIKYLIGEILKDLTIKQGAKKIRPSNLNYEGQLGPKNKIRVTFFAKGLELNSPFQIEYYDRLFGNGIIKFSKNSNTLIS